ncbi:hypothetical protein PVAND_008820 [Polypedilum vanderplanki]|uniref:Uncharacterized protein n=1 Tax=Polypedilum vanderplanki TaxID=319348 RepID=A0A9J6CBJ7_POLVA|nr:hypothetical protein PVAND_008820 [Polypedilum vanderplanki]
MLPSSYVQIVDNNDEKVVDDNQALPPPQQQQQQQQTTCLDETSCPFAQQQQQQQEIRGRSSSLDKHRSSFSMRMIGSQSTLNTLCSHHSMSKGSIHQNAFYNRLYNSDPNTNTIDSHITDDSEYLSNYAHIKHSHRHPHYHLRRQSQPDEPRFMMSRNSSVKSFTSQCYINPEYFYEIRPSTSCDSKASLISRKPSQNQIMLLNSELQLLEGLREGLSNSYPKINYIDKHYLSLNDDAPPLLHHRPVHDYDNGDEEEEEEIDEEEEEVEEEETSSTSSDASEFHENKTSTLDRSKASYVHMHRHDRPLTIPMFSETDSYSTVNDEITQLVSKHLSNSIKQLVARQLTDTDFYALPLRRRHSCDSSELSDIQIPDLFNSPSRIKWNFLTGLPDHSRSQSQIYSSDYKTDEDDDEQKQKQYEKRVEAMMKRKSSSLDPKYQAHHREIEIMPIWRANSYGRARDAMVAHHSCCEAHRRMHTISTRDAEVTTDRNQEEKYPNGNVKEEDTGVYEFELCTKENCEYLSKSQLISTEEKNLLNNEMPGLLPCTKNINLKHNKFKMKKTKKTKSKSSSQKENREQIEDQMIMWNKINLNHLMKKDSCNINSVNFKPHSSSSSSSSINNGGGISNEAGNRNLKKRQKACDKLFNATTTESSSTQQQHRHLQPQQSLNVASLILASFNSTQARIRNDGGIYFSNPDLSNIPADLRSMNFINNNSCQFINNDLRSNVNSTNNNNNNSSSRSSRFDSRFNNLNSATNYLLESINSNNNNSEIMQQQDIRRRLRYINLHGMLRRAQKRAKKYLNSISFASSRK